MQTIQNAAIKEFAESQLCERVRTNGAAWGSIKAFFLDGRLPEHLHDREQFAYQLVKPALDQTFGEQNKGWETFKKNNTAWVRTIDQS